MTRNGHTLEYMDFLKRLGVNTKPKNQVNKGGKIKKYPLLSRPSQHSLEGEHCFPLGKSLFSG